MADAKRRSPGRFPVPSGPVVPVVVEVVLMLLMV